MSNKSIYASVIISKTGTEIPIFPNGRTVDSKYNPEREAENLIQSKFPQMFSTSYTNNKSYFFIVTGVGSGTLIEKLSDYFPESKILAVEACNDDLIFLNKLSKIQNLKLRNNIIFADIENIEEILINNYLPAVFDCFEIIEQRGWIREWLEEDKEIIKILNKKINDAIGIISADFSVQAHFGKIWQSNIINNLRTLSYAENKIFNKNIIENDIKKTAAIVAAGPSLDKSIKNLIKFREKYFIISTDTAFPVLVKNNIIPEAVISIDGQHISHNHFNHGLNCKDTIFLLDLCSDYSIGKFLQSNGNHISYFISDHPLALLANTISTKKFPKFFSGAGTVTITALDFAIQYGFSDIEIFGADFSYSGGKAYAKGTYFDTIFNLNTSKIDSKEKKYSELMYRTNLLKMNEKEYSTDILNAYKMSLERYLTDNKCIFRKENLIYKIKSSYSDKNKENHFNLQSFSYDFCNFIKTIKKAELKELKYPLLPYIAWLKNTKNNESLEFIALLKLAQSNIVRYN